MFEKPFFMILTNRCNLTCPHCYNELDPLKLKDKERDAMSRERLKFVFAELNQQGYKKGFFSGGEALLRPDAPEILGDAKDAGLKTALFTNGHLFSEAVVERLAAAGVDEVRISLNELAWIKNRQQYEHVFARQTHWVPRLREAGIGVGIIYIISNRNKAYTSESFERVRQMGAGMKVQPLYMPTDLKAGSGVSAQELTDKDWDSIIEAAGFHDHKCDYSDEENFEVYNNPWKFLRYVRFVKEVYVNGLRPDFCPTGPILVFDSEGYIHPCLFRYDLTCGHISEDSVIERVSEILEGYSYLKKGSCFKEECLSAYR